MGDNKLKAIEKKTKYMQDQIIQNNEIIKEMEEKCERRDIIKNLVETKAREKMEEVYTKKIELHDNLKSKEEDKIR